jgi:WD40 repeat protein
LFGGGIAVSEDGNTLAISSAGDIVTSTLKGSAYIFSKGGNFTYTQNGPKLYNSAFTTSFTNTIALSADGKVLATAGFQPTCALLVYISL